MRIAAATDRDLDIALERLSQLAYFGVVERFEESMSKLSNYLSAHFDSVDISYDVVNRSPERTGTLEMRLQQIAEATGKELYQELMDKNELDLRLYNAARQLFGAD